MMLLTQIIVGLLIFAHVDLAPDMPSTTIRIFRMVILGVMLGVYGGLHYVDGTHQARAAECR